MKIFIDTNILIDSLLKRHPFYKTSDDVINKCLTEKVMIYIAAHSVTNAFYIMRKVYSEEQRREILLEICNLFDIVEINRKKIIMCLNNSKFKDFEDCLQSECALSVKADYIITRNIKDFANSAVKPILPEDFLDLF